MSWVIDHIVFDKCATRIHCKFWHVLALSGIENPFQTAKFTFFTKRKTSLLIFFQCYSLLTVYDGWEELKLATKHVFPLFCTKTRRNLLGKISHDLIFCRWLSFFAKFVGRISLIKEKKQKQTGRLENKKEAGWTWLVNILSLTNSGNNSWITCQVIILFFIRKQALLSLGLTWATQLIEILEWHLCSLFLFPHSMVYCISYSYHSPQVILDSSELSFFLSYGNSCSFGMIYNFFHC